MEQKPKTCFESNLADEQGARQQQQQSSEKQEVERMHSFVSNNKAEVQAKMFDQTTSTQGDQIPSFAQRSFYAQNKVGVRRITHDLKSETLDNESIEKIGPPTVKSNACWVLTSLKSNLADEQDTPELNEEQEVEQRCLFNSINRAEVQARVSDHYTSTQGDQIPSLAQRSFYAQHKVDARRTIHELPHESETTSIRRSRFQPLFSKSAKVLDVRNTNWLKDVDQESDTSDDESIDEVRHPTVRGNSRWSASGKILRFDGPRKKQDGSTANTHHSKPISNQVPESKSSLFDCYAEKNEKTYEEACVLCWLPLNQSKALTLCNNFIVCSKCAEKVHGKPGAICPICKRDLCGIKFRD